MANTPQNILLVGGGHAHLAVLADWIRRGLPFASASLLTPHRYLRYSGTVPGWIAGQYERDTGLVDLAALARHAGVKWVQGRCTEFDPVQRLVTSDSGAQIPFDLASIDTGGISRSSEALGEDPRVISVRPIERFVDRLEALPAAQRIAVIGGGAGGVELAFALRNRASGAGAHAEIVLVTGEAGPVANLASAVRRRVVKELARQDIRMIEADARIESGALVAGKQLLEPQDAIIAALGSAAPDWTSASGLACDPRGFLAVDEFQRSLSHPHTLAVGDIARRKDCEVPHSGVHAVRAGPVLAANLRALADGAEPKASYVPRRAHLYLLSTGRGEAIASYGPLALQGRMMARLKHAIDMRWLASYSALAEGS